MSRAGGGLLRRPSLVAAAVTALPLSIFSFYLAWLASGEGGRLRTAPRLDQTAPGTRANGTFYRLDGPITSGILPPPEGWPEVTGTLAWQRTFERPDGNGGWQRDASADSAAVAYLTHQRAERIMVGGFTVELGRHARLAVGDDRLTRPLSDGRREVLSSRAPAGDTVTVFGVYQHGFLTEGTYDRILVTDPRHLEAALAAARTEGIFKARILAGMGALALLLSLIAVRLAVGRLRQPLEITESA